MVNSSDYAPNAFDIIAGTVVYAPESVALSGADFTLTAFVPVAIW